MQELYKGVTDESDNRSITKMALIHEEEGGLQKFYNKDLTKNVSNLSSNTHFFFCHFAKFLVSAGVRSNSHL